MIRAYHDPALKHPLSRDGSWASPLELVCSGREGRRKAVYLHNASGITIPLRLEASAPGFVVNAPESVAAVPGVTRLEVGIDPGSLPIPRAVDFLLTGTTADQSGGEAGYSGLTYSDIGNTYESKRVTGTLLKVEATAFALPAGDERFGNHHEAPLKSVAALTEYAASGMGFVDATYKQTAVNFITEHLRDWSMWALNKHYALDARYGPMRHASNRSVSVDYAPPGVPSLHPAIRRNVYARAYELTRGIGSQSGIRSILNALGVPQTELLIWREGFTWFVRVPKWVTANFGIDFLGNVALYHVDPWCIIDIATNQGTEVGVYTDIDWTIQPGHAVQPPGPGPGALHLLLEDGTSSLLLEDGNRLVLDGVSSAPPENAVTYDGDHVTYQGDFVTYEED